MENYRICKGVMLATHMSKMPAAGTVCVADVQENGKGRRGNCWTSPEGCLMATILLGDWVAGLYKYPLIKRIACTWLAQSDICKDQHSLPVYTVS